MPLFVCIVAWNGNETRLVLTVDVFFLRWADFLSGGLTDGLGQPLAREAVLGGHDSIHKALTGHVRTVQKLIDVHDLYR